VTGEYAFNVKVQREKKIINTADEIVREEGSVLGRFVLSTLPSSKEQSKWRYMYLYHFNSKAVVTEYLNMKGNLWERGSLLNVVFYRYNMIRYWGIDGAANVLIPPFFPISVF
jgi:hypothetical protein